MTKATEKKPTTLRGTVVSTKMAKTAVVSVTRYVKHPKYQKYVTISKKYKVHDPESVCVVGKTVMIVETRPISKDKHFKVVPSA